jgi:hypothetical protein
MESETSGTHKEAVVYKSGRPTDIRIVAYYLYGIGSLFLMVGFLIGTGLAKPQPHRMLFGSVVVASRLADSVDKVTGGVGFLLCACGLTRRIRFAWWFSLIFSVHCLTYVVLVVPEFQVDVPGVALNAASIAWLWFRRDYYGVHLAAKTGKEE